MRNSVLLNENNNYNELAEANKGRPTSISSLNFAYLTSSPFVSIVNPIDNSFFEVNVISKGQSPAR